MPIIHIVFIPPESGYLVSGMLGEGNAFFHFLRCFFCKDWVFQSVLGAGYLRFILFYFIFVLVESF